MVVVNETKRGQLLALLEQCAHLNADVRPRTEQGYFTVTVPPPWNGPSQRKAQDAGQDQKMVGAVSQCDMLLFRQLQHITLCAVTQVNDGMEQVLS